MRWSIGQLLPILIVSHVVVTFIFFTAFSPQTVVQRLPTQPFAVAETFFAENTPISTEPTPAEEAAAQQKADQSEDKKIIYAVRSAHQSALGT